MHAAAGARLVEGGQQGLGLGEELPQGLPCECTGAACQQRVGRAVGPQDLAAMGQGQHRLRVGVKELLGPRGLCCRCGALGLGLSQPEAGQTRRKQGDQTQHHPLRGSQLGG